MDTNQLKQRHYMLIVCSSSGRNKFFITKVLWSCVGYQTNWPEFYVIKSIVGFHRSIQTEYNILVINLLNKCTINYFF